MRIADQGPGIKPEHLPKIFKPFFSTKAKGDGLALSSSQKMLRDMGGEIQVESQYGSGATFTVIFPENIPPLTRKNPSGDRLSARHENVAIRCSERRPVGL